jgi:hypothetical protein
VADALAEESGAGVELSSDGVSVTSGTMASGMTGKLSESGRIAEFQCYASVPNSVKQKQRVGEVSPTNLPPSRRISLRVMRFFGRTTFCQSGTRNAADLCECRNCRILSEILS